MGALVQLIDLEDHIDRHAVGLEVFVHAGGAAPAGLEQCAHVLCLPQQRGRTVFGRVFGMDAHLFGGARELPERHVDEQLGAHALAQRRREAGGAHRAREEHHRVEERRAPIFIRACGRAFACACRRRETRDQPRQRRLVECIEPGRVLGFREQQAEQLSEVGRRRRQRQEPRAQTPSELAGDADARREAEVGEQRGGVDFVQEAADQFGDALAVLRIALEHAEHVLQAQHRRRRCIGVAF